MHDAAFNASAGHPGRKNLMVMLAAFGVGRIRDRAYVRTRWSRRRAFVEQTARFEVAEEAAMGRSTFGPGVRGPHVAVRIPVIRGTRVDHFDESHAALDEPAGDQALPAEAGHRPALEAVEACVARFLRDRSNASGAARCMPKAVSIERI